MNDAPLWQAEDVVRAARGRCLHEQSWEAQGVSINSRTTRPGDLFIALQNPLHDGHDDVADAFAAGAAAALVVRYPPRVPSGAPLVFVGNTQDAFRELAREARGRFKGKIVAIAGSVGKTITASMLRLCLGAVGKVYGPQLDEGLWSLPLALMRLPSDADYAVFDVEEEQKDKLEAFSRAVCPDIAIVTSVEAVNLETFGTIEAIADAKTGIFEGMGEKSTVILDRDNKFHAPLAYAAKKRGVGEILSFSEKSRAAASLQEKFPAAEGSAVRALVKKQEVFYLVGAPGRHVVKNSLAALLAAYMASGKLEECAAALPHYRLPAGSGDRHEIALSGGWSFSLIDESHGAAPVSVRAALRVLAQTKIPEGGRRLLALGDMDGLGIAAPDLHMGLLPDILAAGVAQVFCCGDMTRYLYDVLPDSLRGGYAVGSAELALLLAQSMQAGDVLTVKGSEGMQMGKAVEALKALGVPLRQKAANA